MIARAYPSDILGCNVTPRARTIRGFTAALAAVAYSACSAGTGCGSEPANEQATPARDAAPGLDARPTLDGAPLPDAGSPRDAASPEDGAPPSDGALPPAPDLSHTLDPITIDGGTEINGACQSWTLNNDTELFVNKVVATNDGGLHHSNWIWVPDTSYTGPDGTWPCAERGFEQILAAAGGGVFFAQSTQAKSDTQAFPPGVAFKLPPHVRIIGDVHLLNPSNSQISTRVHFDVYTIPKDTVKVELQPMAFTNTSLEIAPASETHARMQCAMPQPDFDVYYVLPHFHDLGAAMQIDVVGGAMDKTPIFRSSGSRGEGRGQTFDPPVNVRGAGSLAITCEYQNPRTSVVRYGVGDQEMCVALLYSNGKKAGGTTLGNFSATEVGGVHYTDALCLAVGSP